MEILEANESGLKGLVFHCYSGNRQQAKIVLDKGWYISLTGVVTFKNAEITREVAKYVPLDRLMIETDAPYLSPEPMRKQKVNEPALLIHTAKFVAALKGDGIDQIHRGRNGYYNTFFFAATYSITAYNKSTYGI